MRTLSSAAVNSINAQQTEQVWLTLLTLDHATLADPMRFVDNRLSVVSRGEVFVAAPFTVELPTQDGETPGEARIVLDNVDRAIVLALREIDSPVSLVIEVVLASQPNTLEVAYTGLSMRMVDWDAEAVMGVLRFEDLLAEPITLIMTPQRFPGLF